MLDIGMLLRSEEMIEFLESFELHVHYHFDRLDEGEDDSYSVSCEEIGLELLFDADQRCKTIFVTDIDAVEAEDLVSFPNLKSPAEVEAYAAREGLLLKRGDSWLRCDGPERCFHYEFDGAAVTRITVMSPATAPG
jgi:hypothetical protein